MNKATLDQVWDQFRQKYGVYLRVLEAIPAECYATHPVPGMRTPSELSVHVSATVVRDIALGVAKGEITADEAAEHGIAAKMGKADTIAFARQCFAQADAAVKRVGDAELAAMVPTPWKASWPGWVAFQIMGDEFLHHRGQLSAYARACGAAPPFIWGYADNAPEFQPRGVAAAGT